MGVQGQTKSNIAITCLKLVVVWGLFGALLAKILLEEGFGTDSDVAARGVQAGALIAALLSLGCYALILDWRRSAVAGNQDADAGQNIFYARAMWFVWGALGLLLAVSLVVGIAKAREPKLHDGTAIAASANSGLPPCKAAGMFASAMALKRDQGMPKEEMQHRYGPNEILDRQTWKRMVDMVYDHPEKSPEAIERAFASHC
ncbi:hypothetical protein [Ralstonia chuxiongensis]|uniref:hypothetical protein n=1 Tax=Ralstonia chuxiongensis TaxID=2957504 RepID=UPI0028F69FCC|nr:hypothetical protein [Ralstonia chuxiongensis]CAJ0769851.1 hypothetical protein R8510_00005 [Ralstonia chuxiongensis]